MANKKTKNKKYFLDNEQKSAQYFTYVHPYPAHEKMLPESIAVTVESTAVTVESTAVTVESTAVTVESTAVTIESIAVTVECRVNCRI